MTSPADFDLEDFLPYLLNQAAETSSRSFQRIYRERYGMLRTEWRVIFHIGRADRITAKDICTRAGLHKTKVSRAVAALEQKRFVERNQDDDDRRVEWLSLTRGGHRAYVDLCGQARAFDAAMMAKFSPDDWETLRRCLRKIREDGPD